ncbi:hypothetical protein [Stakelama saccharophila]|uniref:Preprotein translocase subunit YajC n=1 Tax=Stakelama saccharophila TaxID=3075605 RepID=A0ABZ0B5Y5_9SPHN|nr:hypothetical protein [Stakelama sp. W311]WNO52799.1 hypothetical protein RPR59_10045 [Stakelama sp. W311]
MKGLACLIFLLTLPAAFPAHAQERQITPHVEIGQVLTADLQSGDVLTYTTLGAGVDASIHTRRVEVQLSYQYEHRIAWDDDIGDSDVHSGLARAAVDVARGVTLEGGAIATRARSDIRGPAPGNLAGNVDNVAQVFSGYVGPNVQTQVGPASLSALYRLGYTKVEAPSAFDLPDGQQRRDYYDDSVGQLAMASIGVPAGRIAPIGMTLSAAAEREDAGQLDQRYTGAFVRGDIVLPVSRVLALVAGAGWEDIRISQRDPLLDGDGDPVLDGHGRFVTDPDSPRRIAYETDNPLFWDAGVLWRPSRRTTLEARVGRRYDSWTYTGSLSHQIGPGSGLQVGVYDQVQSFGRQLNGALADLPTRFNTAPDTFGDNYNGCVFGTVGNAAGGCLNGIFQSIVTANYRARGVDAVAAFNRAGNRFGVGLGYANRRFYAPDAADQGFLIDGLEDEGYYAQAFYARSLTAQSSFSANVYANHFRSGVVAAPDVTGLGGTASYYRNFGRLNAIASAGIYAFDSEGPDNDDVSAQAEVALGYVF